MEGEKSFWKQKSGVDKATTLAHWPQKVGG